MSRKRTGRDTWLYAGTQSGEEIKKRAAGSNGRLESPASDRIFRTLVGDPRPRATDWGGRDGDGTVVVVRKSVPDYPESRQLKDPFEGLYSQGIALEPPLPPESLLNLTEENTLHSGCLMAKAYDSAGRGWNFVPKEGKKGDKSLLESDIPARLRETMELLTPELTFGELLYQAAWEREAIGWSVWEVVRQQGKYAVGKYAPLGAVYPVPAHTMRATVDPRRWVQIRAGRVRFFKKFGAKCEVDAETGQVWDWNVKKDVEALQKGVDPGRLASEVIVFKSYTPRSLWYGLPLWVSAIPTIAELTAIREFNVSWFASGGQTDYIVHFASTDLQVAQKMVDDTRRQMQENQGRGHTNILVAGSEDTKVTAQKLGELLREGHFRFRRGDLAKEVLIAHNTPPYRVGWAETGSLAGNAAQEMLGAYKFGAIEPIQTVIEDRLRATLFDKDMGLDTGDFRFQLEDLDLDELEKELAKVSKMVDSAMMTPNQGREELGYEAVAEGEEGGEQAGAMNKYYFKGQELGKEPPAAANPFGPGAAPGQPVPGQLGEAEKSADATLDVIKEFEKTLREALRDEEPAPADAADASDTPPSERRRRRPRGQNI